MIRPGGRKRQSSGKGGVGICSPPAKFRLGSVGSRGGEVKASVCQMLKSAHCPILLAIHLQVGDECQVNLSFHGWLGSVTERINQTMHYQVLSYFTQNMIKTDQHFLV